MTNKYKDFNELITNNLDKIEYKSTSIEKISLMQKIRYIYIERLAYNNIISEDKMDNLMNLYQDYLRLQGLYTEQTMKELFDKDYHNNNKEIIKKELDKLKKVLDEYNILDFNININDYIDHVIETKKR